MDHSPGFLAHVEGRRPHVHEVSIPETLATLQATPAAVLIVSPRDRVPSADTSPSPLITVPRTGKR